MEYPVWRVLCVMLFLSFDKGNVHALKMSVFNGALTSVCVLPMYVYTLYTPGPSGSVIAHVRKHCG